MIHSLSLLCSLPATPTDITAAGSIQPFFYLRKAPTRLLKTSMPRLAARVGNLFLSAYLRINLRNAGLGTL